MSENAADWTDWLFKINQNLHFSTGQNNSAVCRSEFREVNILCLPDTKIIKILERIFATNWFFESPLTLWTSNLKYLNRTNYFHTNANAKTMLCPILSVSKLQLSADIRARRGTGEEGNKIDCLKCSTISKFASHSPHCDQSGECRVPSLSLSSARSILSREFCTNLKSSPGQAKAAVVPAIIARNICK